MSGFGSGPVAAGACRAFRWCQEPAHRPHSRHGGTVGEWFGLSPNNRRNGVICQLSLICDEDGSPEAGEVRPVLSLTAGGSSPVSVELDWSSVLELVDALTTAGQNAQPALA